MSDSNLAQIARNRRLAILIGNTVIWSHKRVNVDEPALKSNMRRFESELTSMGDFSFSCHSMINLTVPTVRSRLRDLLDDYSGYLGEDGVDDSSCLLIYYFGHGAIRDNGLRLTQFKQSKVKNPEPNNIGFSFISDEVKNHDIPRAIFAIDCCFAGASQYSLGDLGPTRFCLLASSTNENLSYIMGDETGQIPIGAFSSLLFDGLNSPEAADEETLQLTPRLLFQYIQANIQGMQEPSFSDGQLADFLLNEVKPRSDFDPGHSFQQPPSTLYRKIKWICDHIKDNPSVIHDIYVKQIDISRPPKGFLCTGKDSQGRIVSRPIGIEVFISYVATLHALGLVQLHRPNGKEVIERPSDILELEDAKASLSADGEHLIAGNGREFNTVLVACIERRIDEEGISLDDVGKIIRRKWADKVFPTADEIFNDAVRTLHVNPSALASHELRTYLELLARVGYLQSTPHSTFYPAR